MKLPKLLQRDQNNLEIQGIKAVIKANKELRMHERYQTILLDLHGVSKKSISKIIGRSLSTVYNYINAYRHGLHRSSENGSNETLACCTRIVEPENCSID